MERDLEMARRVQLRLLPPHNLPNSSVPSLRPRFNAARSIGGDVYDFLDYGPGRVALAIGDVSGRGGSRCPLCRACAGRNPALLATQHLPPAALLRGPQRSASGAAARFAVCHHAGRHLERLNQTIQVANAGSVQPSVRLHQLQRLTYVGGCQDHPGRRLSSSASSQTLSMKSSPCRPAPAICSSSSPTAFPMPRMPKAICSEPIVWPSCSNRSGKRQQPQRSKPS